MSVETCDVVIIGSGIGGLTCGTALARAGLRVTLCEQHQRPGGCCSYFTRKGFLFDAGAHLFGSVGNVRTPLGRFLRDIEFDAEFIQVDPMDIVHIAGDTIRIPANVYDYIELLKREFPAEKGIETFFHAVRRIYRNFMRGESLEKYRTSTYADVLDHFLKDERLKAVLSSQWGYMGLPADRISAVAMCIMLATYFFDGAYYPRGGTKRFVDALAKRFEHFGGKLRLSARVKEIRVTGNGTVSGVALEGGEEVRARVVVSNADLTETITELIQEPRLNALRDTVRKMKKSVSGFITYLGIDMDPELLRDKRGWYFENYDTGDPNNTPFYVSIPAVIDPVTAPGHAHTMHIIKFRFDQSDVNWAEEKDAMEEGVLTWAEQKIPGLGRHIKVKESATPATLYRYTRNSEGALYGWAMDPVQMGPARPGNDTPVNGLFLAGHWTWPAGGIASVMFSGLNAARLVTAYRKEIQ